MGIVDTNGATLAILNERQSIQAVHQLQRHLFGELHVRLLVFATCYVHSQSGDKASSMLGKEHENISLQAAVWDVRVQVPHP